MEDVAPLLIRVPEQGRIDEISVVGDGNLALGVLGHEGLGVDGNARPGRAVAGMGDGHGIVELGNHLFIEDLAHQAHGLVAGNGIPVTGSDPGRLLTAVLQGEDAKVRQLRGPGMINTENTATIFAKSH